MAKGSEGRIGLAIWVLLAAGLALGWPGGALPAQPGTGPGEVVLAQAGEEAGEEAEEPRFTGALDIRLQSEEDRLNPPAEMLLVDPRGATTGYDPRTGSAYQEIPGSTYDWESTGGGRGPREVIIHVRNAPSGLYSLRLIATRTGGYRLHLRAFEEGWGRADVRFTEAKILRGTVQHYLINFSREGPRLSVRRTRISE